MKNATLWAAIDLGSNSFRLEIGTADNGRYVRTEYRKETIRLGGGLDAARNLQPEALQKAWDCVAAFGKRIQGFPKENVRAVATQTVREAKNRDEFLVRATELLGYPIDLISGREEARLIYAGVAQAIPPTPEERRLVIDIGGRSTEVILGQGLRPGFMESYRLGSISWSQRFFGQGVWSAQAFDVAQIAAKAVIDEALVHCGSGLWDKAYGSAGTVNAVGDALVAAGYAPGEVCMEGLAWLQAQLIAAGNAENLAMEGIKEDRKAIIGGGVSILRALFDLLGIQTLRQASGGLRHGLLADLMNRDSQHTDVQAHTVDRLVEKFCADPVHGERVARVAALLYGQLCAPGAPERDDTPGARELRWACRLHEIGCHISHTDAHKHGAYILENADAMGFTQAQQHRLGLLVLGHRGKLRKLNIDFEDEPLVRELLALRLAVALCHARHDPDVQGVCLVRDPQRRNGHLLHVHSDWARRFPQSAHLLREETLAWQKTPCAFQVVESKLGD
ncbi:Ppx/GppA phosphatase family protein [Candidatus Symbiobacter mobilis]|uniref:Exopolyphosphatase n=1 Tax=Candidatus Symbiobacter mobilis CR TaxID=946483 RepID=U5N9P1_9BURK|nr:Ppx/GppA phosphatase family protein [Candidatus Symbiobacter mobilis]AGX86958.1 exopolyphosphatase [Candidatus Symbiobacter mobilis CR]